MITIKQTELKAMLFKAAKLGADEAINALVSYNLKDAAMRIGITPKTLSKRIFEQKIHSVDGRVAGAEIRRYLQEKNGLDN